MTNPPIALRFVNTPTVGMLYESEHTGEEMGVSNKAVDELSDEYNSVSGNESYYYKLLFEHLQAPNQDLGNRAGNEGLVEWIGNLVGGLISKVKMFFKWLFSFFSSKGAVAKSKIQELEHKLDTHGVKPGYHAYPAVYVALWANRNKVPEHLDWITDSLGTLEKAIEKGTGYIKEIKKVMETLYAVYQEKGTTPENKDIYESILKNHHSSLVKLLGTEGTAFTGGVKLSVSGEGLVKLVPNPDLLQPDKEARFTTTDITARGLFKQLDKLNNTFSKLIVDSTELEHIFIKQLEAAISYVKKIQTAENSKLAEPGVNTLKKVISQSMTGIKAIETLLYKSIAAGVSVLEATINKG